MKQFKKDQHESPGAGLRFVSPPQLAFLLDENAKLLQTFGPASSGDHRTFDITDANCIHSALHANCAGDCRFNKAWRTAWSNFLKNKQMHEWELDDTVIDKVVRMSLVAAPDIRYEKVERRSVFAILTIKDITECRTTRDSLMIERGQSLRLLNGVQVESGKPVEHLRSSDIDYTFEKDWLAEAHDRLRSTAFKSVATQENERKRIAMELHDGFAQLLGAVKYKIEATCVEIDSRNVEMDTGLLEDALGEIKVIAEELRRISSDLLPSKLEDDGFISAVQSLCDDFKSRFSSVDVRCEITASEDRIPDLVKITAYRVIQEALNNIFKHANPKSAGVTMEESDEGIFLVIHDDGKGFELDKVQRKVRGHPSLGLASMRERVESAFGQFDIETRPGKGVRILVTWTRNALEFITAE